MNYLLTSTPYQLDWKRLSSTKLRDQVFLVQYFKEIFNEQLKICFGTQTKLLYLQQNSFGENFENSLNIQPKYTY